MHTVAAATAFDGAQNDAANASPAVENTTPPATARNAPRARGAGTLIHSPTVRGVQVRVLVVSTVVG